MALSSSRPDSPRKLIKMLETEDKKTTFFQNISNYLTVEHHITYLKNVSTQALMYNTKSSPRKKASKFYQKKTVKEH
jgi:hypothetical protein